MNGPNDVGGMAGFGAIAPERNEPVFHAEWEKRAFALCMAMNATGLQTIDGRRFDRERLPPAFYWSHSYYEIWIAGLMSMLARFGLADADELADGRLRTPARPLPKKLLANQVAGRVAAGSPFDRPAGAPARFDVGDRVRVRNLHPHGHTRMPIYARGRAGSIVRVHGVHVFPDTAAHGRGESPHWLYNVRFDAAELWGKEEWGGVHIDLWEPYLEPAQ